MKVRVLLIGILLSICIKSSICQDWIRIYGGSLNTSVYSVFEHYDKGFIFSGMQYDNSYHPNAWIQKTDVNGLVLWQKYFGFPQKYCNFFGSARTSDGGTISIGKTDIIQLTCKDPFIVKSNSCGEKEWCRIYNAPGCNAVGRDIEVTIDGFMALIDGWKSGEEQAIWLFRLDSLGEVIWAQVYATDPTWNSEVSRSLLKTSDSCFIITGEAYYPDPTYPSLKIIKIILIKTNLNGEIVFEVPWGTNNGVYSKGFKSIEDGNHSIYTAGEHPRTSFPGGDSPCLFKTNLTGTPVAYYDMLNTTINGISTTIDWLQDSTIFLGSRWGYSSGVDTIGIFKSTKTGTLINSKPLLTLLNGTLQSSAITFNNKAIFTGSFYSAGLWRAYAFKLTSDLEYDSIYTAPFTYDSLCPHPIVSDTIPLDDCEVMVVGIDDPVQHREKTKLKVYPNPAGNVVTVEMPVYLVRSQEVRKSGGQGINYFGIKATTFYHQWKSVRLDVFDLFGKLMYSQEIQGRTDKIELNISSWPVGMYVARIVFMNDIVGVVKFIKE